MVQKTLYDWQREASVYITGGMSSNFRENQFTGVPMYAEKADGARFTDLTGKEYVDFLCVRVRYCWGIIILM